MPPIAEIGVERRGDSIGHRSGHNRANFLSAIKLPLGPDESSTSLDLRVVHGEITHLQSHIVRILIRPSGFGEESWFEIDQVDPGERVRYFGQPTEVDDSVPMLKVDHAKARSQEQWQVRFLINLIASAFERGMVFEETPKVYE